MTTPKKPRAARTKEVKLFGGPVSGTLVRVPGKARVYHVGALARFWTYEYAGKDGGIEMFALRSVNRMVRRLIALGMANGRPHPLVEREYTKQRPAVGSAPSKGRGARRRAAARAAKP